MKSVDLLRRAARIAVDAQIFLFGYYIAFWLRLNDDLDAFDPSLAVSALSFTSVSLAVFIMTGAARRSWRFFGTRDLVEIVRDVALAVSIYTLIGFLLSRLLIVPRSVPIIAFFVVVVGLASVRIAYRAFFDGFKPSWLLGGAPASRPTPTRVLVYGATRWTGGFLAMLAANDDNAIEVVGIVDDDPGSRDRRIEGLGVVSSLSGLPALIDDLRASAPPITQIVLTDPFLSPREMRRVFDVAASASLDVARVPKLDSLVLGSGKEVDLEPLDIADLLGRDVADLDIEGLGSLIRGKVVLVTGAGGSIGSELCRQIIAHAPGVFVLVDHCELNLFNIDRDLSTEAARRGVTLIPRLMSIRDRDRVRTMFESQRIELVFHAAAYKHVHLIEKNPIEGIWTNVVGTAIVAKAARDFGAKAMVMVSTDKAVNPTSIMGMTKRAAERYCLALDDLRRSTRSGASFVVVRFGNVLGSSGSVVPIFERQIRRGGPVTVTDEGVTRYFMAIPEAVQLVLQGSVYALNARDRRSAVLVLDMGEPVKIIDLARRMIEIMKPNASDDIPIVITGLKPGEKMHEELFDDEESRDLTLSEGFMEAWSSYPAYSVVSAAIDRIEAACARSDAAGALDCLKGMIAAKDATTRGRELALEKDVIANGDFGHAQAAVAALSG